MYIYSVRVSFDVLLIDVIPNKELKFDDFLI
jgi:hypothetical protein